MIKAQKNLSVYIMCKRISLIFWGPEGLFEGLKKIIKVENRYISDPSGDAVPIFARNCVFRCVLNHPFGNIMNKVVGHPQKSKKPLF